MRWRERCPLLPVPNQVTWRPSRLCVRIWRNTAAPGQRPTCGPGTARILTEASLACGPRTLRSVKRWQKRFRPRTKPYNPERIRVPALAIYAAPKSADDLMRRGSSDRSAFPELVARAADDPALRERVEKLYLLTRERVRKHEKWFEAFAERGRVVELSGTHDLIISNPREVLQQIEAFVSSLPARR